MSINLRSILLYILLIYIIVKNINCSISNGKRTVYKRKETYQKRNENAYDKFQERTLKKLRTENGRLLLVVCKSKCLKERADIAAWLSEYNKKSSINSQNFHKEINETHEEATKNVSKSTYQPLGIHIHYYQKSFPIAEIERKIKKSSKQVIAFYVADGKEFQIPDKDLTRKEMFLQWLEAYEHPTNIILLKEAIELDEWLNNECNEVTRRSLDQTEICPEPLLKNFARSFMNRSNYVAVELRRPLNEENEFILQWRLKGIGEMCRIIVLIRRNGFMELSPDITFYETISNISQIGINQNCTIINQPQEMQEIMPQLNPIELEFFKEERHLKSIEQNRQYLAVGTIGGVAVMALAMSIFWGLNGNDFVPKK
ncbi:unnamed protein product [Meloidogyne enterolobii]|uniref:Uncharacterized protein n=1 Tax=Meloidogyne enterolobii TaxID=390850 RepID=A0ACB0Z6S7_MELEN